MIKKFKFVTVLLVLTTIFASVFATGCGMKSIPTAQNDVDASWAEVLNQFKRRADLIPNLVSTVKGYAAHEKDTLQAVVEARAKATQTNVNADQLTPETMKKFSQAQGQLSSALSHLMVVVEKYPDLKANENFRDLQVQLEGTENRVTIARQRFIAAVNVFNNLVSVPPESWYNSMFLKLQKKPQFTVENLDQVKDAPKVQF